MSESRYVYSFGEGRADSCADGRRLLGVKGANLAEMTRLGLPVPPGFTLSTELCQVFHRADGQLSEAVRAETRAALALLEERTGLRFGDAETPLLLSVRSGAAEAMPGMMDTVLNLGLNHTTVEGLARRTGDARFAHDSHRRFIQMYADVALGMPHGVLERLVDRVLDECEAERPNARGAETNRELVRLFEEEILATTGRAFPQDPWEQLWAAIAAVFRSWENKLAIGFRRDHGISDDLGTAVSVQAMVFGNLGETSATGVAYTHDAHTGARGFCGDWLPDAQGEDVINSPRNAQPLNEGSRWRGHGATLQDTLPKVYGELLEAQHTLEAHYRDTQEIEFTVERGKLWLLQTRAGDRTPRAEVRIAFDMANEGLISRSEAVERVRTTTLEHLLHPQIDPEAQRTVVASGDGASPGAGTGRVVFTADDAVEWAGRGQDVILVRPETSPEDVRGMMKARGILTRVGGMTSHAAVVARGLNKPCVIGCRSVYIDVEARELRSGDVVIREGDVVTLDGTEGTLMLGAVPMIQPDPSQELRDFMGWIDAFRELAVYTNADTASDCQRALDFGAEGIGLCRTEHMFFDGDRIQAVREMILADDEVGRRRALAKIEPMQRADFQAIFEVMDGLPVTIRLLDPPLHEFLPQTEREIAALADELGVTATLLDARVRGVQEQNPMLGHRGCRLGITVPEIYEMQARAIAHAACEAQAGGVAVVPEIMIPLVVEARELVILRALVSRAVDTVLEERGCELEYRIGTMIELPRACLTADAIAGVADFLSFGTNDLTQTTFGISRDDAGKFLSRYTELGILPVDPFVSLDPAVARLMETAVGLARGVRPDIKIGLCGEHGGEAASIAVCQRLGMAYVSCSPYRVPVARLAAAHAAIAEAR